MPLGLEQNNPISKVTTPAMHVEPSLQRPFINDQALGLAQLQQGVVDLKAGIAVARSQNPDEFTKHNDGHINRSRTGDGGQSSFVLGHVLANKEANQDIRIKRNHSPRIDRSYEATAPATIPSSISSTVNGF